MKILSPSHSPKTYKNVLVLELFWFYQNSSMNYAGYLLRFDFRFWLSRQQRSMFHWTMPIRVVLPQSQRNRPCLSFPLFNMVRSSSRHSNTIRFENQIIRIVRRKQYYKLQQKYQMNEWYNQSLEAIPLIQESKDKFFNFILALIKIWIFVLFVSSQTPQWQHYNCGSKEQQTHSV